MFKVELAKPSKRLTEVSDNRQDLEERHELSVMHKYSKAQGGKMYEVHRWPHSIANDTNRFNHPHMMSESELYEFSGLSPLNFWSYCQILDGYGCKDRSTISLPSQVLLFRVKLWQIRDQFKNYLFIVFQTRPTTHYVQARNQEAMEM